ncbi:MAG: potassium-transporting ATPase subunit KdpA [candidate division Zixibacteria bacterium]|nr:potassium-transporting ATPase subunit KdpA [candidate division Zixibacteria bacterium]
MPPGDLIQILIYFGALAVLAPLLGFFMARVFEGKRTVLHPALSWIERIVYRLGGVDSKAEMRWSQYAWALVWFNLLGFLFVFVLQLVQNWLPLNPQGLGNVPWDLALNTAVSFMTNTNWQSYAGETTMSYGTQMLALTVQNFVSAATGIAVLLALARGIARKTSATIGNFWTDLTRSVVYVLLPLAIVLAVVLVGEGVVQNFSPAETVITVEGGTQQVPLGPAASQIAIKQLGTNGGGYFNANSAHPLENPTPLSNFLEMLAILLLPAALVFTYGRMVTARRHAWIIAGVMLLLLLGGLAGSMIAEYQRNPVLGATVNLEGKETRFGVVNSVLWSVATTAASNGSVNAMHGSLSPLAGGVALFNIMLGEIVFGGVGAGMYGMLLHVLLTVFLAGLMVGRTPEYLGKKIEAREIQMVIIAILAPSAVILVGSGLACVLPVALASLANAGPHGLTELLYAYSSAAGNNGSAFAGLNANTPFFNITLALSMLIGRFVVILPCLAIAGSLAAKKASAKTAGTFETDTTLFAVLLIATILIVGALTFFPALCLGPVVEHFLMGLGRTF